jgi:hypothetical protein
MDCDRAFEEARVVFQTPSCVHVVCTGINSWPHSARILVVSDVPILPGPAPTALCLCLAHRLPSRFLRRCPPLGY